MERKKSESHGFLVQGSILAAASLISRLIGMIYRIPLNNILGDEGAGIYAYAYKIYNIFLILSCYSIPTAVSRLVAVKLQKKEHKNAYRVFLISLGFGLIIGSIGFLILFFGADFFAVHFFSNARVAHPMKILAPNILIFAVMGVFRGYFQGKNTMLPTSISQILEQIVNAIVSIVAAYCYMMAHSASVDIAAYGASGGTLGTVMGSLTGLLFLLFVFTIYQPILKKQIRRDVNAETDSYRMTIRLLLATIAPIILSQAVYQVSGLLDVRFFHSILSKKGYDALYRDTMIGIYGGKYELLTNVPIAIATAIGAAIVPSLVASLTNNNMGEIKRKIHAAIKFNMIIAIPSAVGLAVLANPIIQLLFRGKPENMELAAVLLQVGSIAVVLVALSTTSNAILQSLNQLKIPVYHNALALVIHLIVVILLLKFTEAKLYALVLGYILFALIVSVLNWRYIARKYSYRQEIIKTFILPFLASVVMGILCAGVYFGMHKLLHSNLLATLIAIIISMVAYFLLLVFMHAISEKEILMLPKGEKLLQMLKKLHLL